MRSVARRFRRSLSTVQRWVRRAGNERIDRVDFAAHKPGCRRSPSRVSPATEKAIVQTRSRLRDRSDLGEHGADAIRAELVRLGFEDVPSARTVGRVLARCGALDGRGRVRRPPPPRGWYLPQLACGRVELDSFDIVEGLAIRGGRCVEVLNAISLHGRTADSWPVAKVVTARFAADCVLSRWAELGLPAYAQFDNDTIFQGAHHVRDTFGRITRLCQQLGVVPVFAPPNQQGFQAAIECYNRLWQKKVWERFVHASVAALARRSTSYVLAHRDAHARPDLATRSPLPKRWTLDLTRPLCGRVYFLRRTDGEGQASVLGHRVRVDRAWPHRLVRAEVDLDACRIRFFALRRRDPEHQPLLRETRYEPPRRAFIDR